jgi:hypothetical protein
MTGFFFGLSPCAYYPLDAFFARETICIHVQDFGRTHFGHTTVKGSRGL